jgi:glycosyltransferase involved in cell wall biosynthesis
MTVYNTEKYLIESIESILKQSYRDFELIICDDGSQDLSKKIIQKYADQDTRIIFLDNQKNRGITACLNECLAQSC